MTGLKEFAEAEAPELKDDELIRMAEERGYLIHRPQPQERILEFDPKRIKGDRVRVAIISDLHLRSKYQQVTHLSGFLKYAKKRKVDAILNAGDVTDGPPEMHKGQVHNLFLHTYEAQRQYAIDTLPDVGIPHYVISGNHDESWLKNNAGPIVEDICAARDDMTFVGQSQGYVRFGDVLLEMAHPHEGVAYALSYKLQKHIEQLAPENKPHIYLAGNYHKACHLPGYRNVEGFLVPSFQAQTPFLKSKRIQSVMGGVILEFGIVTKGLAPSMSVEWVIQREAIPADWPGA